MALDIHETTGGLIECRHDSTALGHFFNAIGTLVLGVLAFDLTLGSRGAHRAVGLAVTAFTCFGFGLLGLERSHFTFNTHARLIAWSRRHGLNCRQGQLSFDDIDEVFAHSPIGDEGTPSRRLVLKLRDGREMPLTANFLVDHDDKIFRFAHRLRALLAKENNTDHRVSANYINTNVLALVRAGHEMDAIRLLCESTKVDLTTAKQRIEDIKRGGY